MPALAWKSFGTVDPSHQYTVMASRLPLARYRDVPTFLRATMDIRRQLTRADGLVGYGLDAKLLRRTFWTLSVWRDADALDAFARSQPHATHVERVRPLVDTTTFVTWVAPGDQLPVTWEQARGRVSAAA